VEAENAKPQGVDRELTGQQIRQAVDFYQPSREAGEFQPTEDVLNSSNSYSLKIWTTLKNSRPNLRGGYLSLIVTHAFTAASHGHLRIVDSNDDLIMPISPIYSDTPAGVIYANRGDRLFHFDLLEGNEGRLDSNDLGDLYLSTSLPIGVGEISVSGILWGEESA